MVYRGKVRGSVVVLQPGIQLPDGLEVTIEPVQTQSPQPSPAGRQSTMRNGVPVFPASTPGGAPGLDLVNQLRDETP